MTALLSLIVCPLSCSACPPQKGVAFVPTALVDRQLKWRCMQTLTLELMSHHMSLFHKFLRILWVSCHYIMPPKKKKKKKPKNLSFGTMDCSNTHLPLLFPMALIKLSSFWMRNAVASYHEHSSFLLPLFYIPLITTERLLNSTQDFILLWYPPWARAILLQRVALCYVYVMTQGRC